MNMQVKKRTQWRQLQMTLSNAMITTRSFTISTSQFPSWSTLRTPNMHTFRSANRTVIWRFLCSQKWSIVSSVWWTTSCLWATWEPSFAPLTSIKSSSRASSFTTVVSRMCTLRLYWPRRTNLSMWAVSFSSMKSSAQDHLKRSSRSSRDPNHIIFKL